MLKRRDFVAGVGAVAAVQLLPAAAFTETSNAAGANETADLVPPPPGGLRANVNYWMYAGGKPITDLTVEIDFSEDVSAETGFSLQLNGWSPTSARSVWQQYCYGFYTENRAKPYLSWSIENWPSDEYREHLRRTIGLPTGDLFNLHGEHAMVPGPGIKVPKGYKFKITLLHDPKDVGGAITGAAYSVIDNHGRTIIDDRPLIRAYKFNRTNAPIEQAALDPIVTFQVNICKRAGGNYGFMESGAGTITYTCATPLTALSRRPDGLAAPSVITAEWANTVYGELPAAPARRFTQTFDTIKAPAFRPGGPFAVSRRFGSDRTDLFAVSVSGQLEMFSVDGAKRWARSGAHGPINMAQPGTAIAATKRFGTDNQAGVFLIAQNGQLQAFWVGPNGVEGPIPVGANDLAPPGTPVAAARQLAARDQTDVFLIDKTGRLNVFWTFAAGPLQGPNTIGPEGFAPNRAHLTAWQRPGTKQTEVFAVDKSGALSRFWVEGGGHWNGPEKISPADFAGPGANVAVAQRADTAEQTDAFVVDKHGQLERFSLEKDGSWSGPVPVGPKGFADWGAPIAVSPSLGGNRVGAFVVDKKGRLIAFSSDGAGDWSQPEQIGAPGAAPSAAHVVVSPQFGVPNQTDVFVINHTGTGGAGWPTVTWVDDKSAWNGPKKLAVEI